MITNDCGGFLSRSMPPSDWDYGIPKSVYDKNLSVTDIREILEENYKSESNKERLDVGNSPLDILQFELSMEILAEIDAKTIFRHNNCY